VKVILAGDPKVEHIYLERTEEDEAHLVSVERTSSKMGLSDFRKRFMLTNSWDDLRIAVSILAVGEECEGIRVIGRKP
jgi:hypothetical protein